MDTVYLLNLEEARAVYENLFNFIEMAHTASWSAVEGSNESYKSNEIDARGRRRRSRVQKHVRNVVSDVRADSYGDWRAQIQFLC